MKHTRTTRNDTLCELFHKWIADRNGDAGSLDDLFDYAKSRGLYSPPNLSERRIFKMEMSKAISRERVVDENGTPIRRNHVFRVRADVPGQSYLYFWGEMLKMKPGQMKMSMQQRLLGLANRAIQLDRDKTYYNDNNEYGAQLDLDFDLRPHVENAKNPTEYPDERPEDDGDGQPV